MVANKPNVSYMEVISEKHYQPILVMANIRNRARKVIVNM